MFSDLQKFSRDSAACGDSRTLGLFHSQRPWIGAAGDCARAVIGSAISRAEQNRAMRAKRLRMAECISRSGSKK